MYPSKNLVCALFIRCNEIEILLYLSEKTKNLRVYLEICKTNKSLCEYMVRLCM